MLRATLAFRRKQTVCFRRGKMAENEVRGPLGRCASRLLAAPAAAAGRSHSVPRPGAARRFTFRPYGSHGSHAGRGGRHGHALEADRRDENRQAFNNESSEGSSFAADTFHSFHLPGGTVSMGDKVPHGLEWENDALSVPGCRLTALLDAPDSPADGDACPKSVFCRTSSAGASLCVSPADGLMLSRKNRRVIKPAVENARQPAGGATPPLRAA